MLPALCPSFRIPPSHTFKMPLLKSSLVCALQKIFISTTFNISQPKLSFAFGTTCHLTLLNTSHIPLVYNRPRHLLEYLERKVPNSFQQNQTQPPLLLTKLITLTILEIAQAYPHILSPMLPSISTLNPNHNWDPPSTPHLKLNVDISFINFDYPLVLAMFFVITQVHLLLQGPTIPGPLSSGGGGVGPTTGVTLDLRLSLQRYIDGK